MTDRDETTTADADGRPRPRQRGVRAALVSLPAPRASEKFWDTIELGLEDQDQLDIVTRPAVRSITEPPPISQPTLDDDPRNALAAYRPTGVPRPEHTLRPLVDEDVARRRRILTTVAVLAVLVGLGGAAILRGDEEGPPLSATTTASPGAPGQQAVVTTVPTVPGLDPSMPLTFAGIGPLYAGMTLAELQDLGAAVVLDPTTFDGSGGTCYDVHLPGASDLTLRYRSPDPSVGVADPREGLLASVNIDVAFGSTRVTDVGLGLGATEEQVRGAHAGNVRVTDRSDLSGGHVYLVRARDGSGTGMAYFTDGYQVTEISVGDENVVPLRQACA